MQNRRNTLQFAQEQPDLNYSPTNWSMQADLWTLRISFLTPYTVNATSVQELTATVTVTEQVAPNAGTDVNTLQFAQEQLKL
jgi:hypothetical protein